MTQKEEALEALNRMRRNASIGLSAGDYEIMNPDGYAIDMDTHFEDVETLRQYIEGQGWQPIESAPRDGATVMVWRENHGGIWWGSFDGHKWLVVYGNNKVHARDITHWMPLPEPPSGEE